MAKNITLSVAYNKEYLKQYGEKKYYVYYENCTLFCFANRFKGKWFFWSEHYRTAATSPFAIVESKTVPMEQILNLTRSFVTILLAGETIGEVAFEGDKITVNRKAVEQPGTEPLAEYHARPENLRKYLERHGLNPS